MNTNLHEGLADGSITFTSLAYVRWLEEQGHRPAGYVADVAGQALLVDEENKAVWLTRRAMDALIAKYRTPMSQQEKNELAVVSREVRELKGNRERSEEEDQTLAKLRHNKRALLDRRWGYPSPPKGVVKAADLASAVRVQAPPPTDLPGE
jgi:hypothetical protein